MKQLSFFINVHRILVEHDLQRACGEIAALIREYESSHTVYGFQQGDTWILVLMGTSHPAADLLQCIENVLNTVSAQMVVPTPKMTEELIKDYVARQSPTPENLKISVRKVMIRYKKGKTSPNTRKKPKKK